MTPSVYQQAVYEFVKNQHGNCFVEAVAGSGKTTTGVESVKGLNRNLRILFVAFSKLIADEFKDRLPQGIDCCTLNAFGWRQSSRLKRPRLVTWAKDGSGKTREHIKTLSETWHLEEKVIKKITYPMCRLISLLKAEGVYVSCTPEDVVTMADKHNIEYPNMGGRFIELFKELYDSVINDTNNYDFDDQLFMPLRFEMPIPQYDIVYVDEAQDLSPVQIDLIAKAAGDFGRIIAIGDRRQSIYGFRGANPEAVDSMISRFNMQLLPLSICYRCSKAVVNEAKKIVPQIEAAPDAIEGVVDNQNVAHMRKELRAGEIVVCRTTAPVVKECLNRIKMGKTGMVKGKDIGRGLVQLIEEVGEDGTIADFQSRLNDYTNQMVSRYKELNRETAADSLQDRSDTVAVFLPHHNRIADVKAFINFMFTDDFDKNTVTFMTIHKSKGLQAKNVWFFGPELVPHKNAKRDWQIAQEHNLIYVGDTRAQDQLHFVPIPKDER